MDPGEGEVPGTEIPVPGVMPVDHTADVGLEIRADDGAELFRRAAAGMMYLILERLPDEAVERRELRVSADDPAGLLREWLRELLYWHETEGFAVAAVDVRRLETSDGEENGAVLEAVVLGAFGGEAPVREIKGVTLHGLSLESRNGGWRGRVIFDV